MNMTIQPIHAFQDNYVWLLAKAQKAIAVDPGEATPVVEALQQQGLALEEIWVTHHHGDHVGGIAELRKAWPQVRVRAPAGSSIPEAFCHHDGDSFDAFSDSCLPVEVLFVPGHTSDHIAFMLRPSEQPPALFCGDTLFAGGCGRLFGGTADQLYTSLQRIARLPANTRVYCAHEYTESNLRFAVAVEPGNTVLQNRTDAVREQRQLGLATVPSTLAEELQTNPFLRVDCPEICNSVINQSLNKPSHPHEIFRDLRLWKDTFK